MTGAGPGTPEAPVRLAIVGVGHLGRHHARVAAVLPNARLVGVHDHHLGRAEEVAREEGVAVLSRLEEVAAQAEAVVIATPTSSHAELGEYFLDRGLDVLVEKPIASTLRQADRLVELARARGRVLQVGHVERYNPAVEAMLALVREPLFIEGHRLGVFTPRSLDVDVVLDLMIHDLQIVLDLVRRPVREIRAAGVPVVTDRLDIATARLTFEGGCVANLTASRISAERMRKLRVFGRGFYCSVDMHARHVDAYRLSQDSDGPHIVRVEVPVSEGDPLARELSDFLEAVRKRGQPRVSGEAARDALALAEGVLAAVAEHRNATGDPRP